MTGSPESRAVFRIGAFCGRQALGAVVEAGRGVERPGDDMKPLLQALRELLGRIWGAIQMAITRQVITSLGLRK